MVFKPLFCDLAMRNRHWAICLILVIPMLSGCMYQDDATNSQQQQDPIPEQQLDHEACVIHDEVERCWFMIVPGNVTPAYCKEQSCPLLVDLHAYMERPIEQFEVSGLADMASEDDAITVYPMGQDDYSWNAGGSCCGDALELQIDDVGYITALIDYMIEHWHTDASRVYLSGWSNGCSLAQKITSEVSHQIAAMGCMAGYLFNEVHSSYSPVPIMEVHGVQDVWSPYGSIFGHALIFNQSTDGDEGAIQNLEKWAEANMCSGSNPQVIEMYEDYSLIGYQECENDAETILVTLNFAGHNPYSNEYTGTWEGGPTLYSNPTGVDVSRMVWDFMSQFSKDVTS